MVKTPAYSKTAMLSIPLVFGLVLVVFGARFILQAQASNDWPQTQAVITKIGLIETSSSTNTTTSKQKTIDVSVLYRYQVNNKYYQSDKYSLGEGSTLKSRLKNRVLAQKWLDNSPYKKGHKISIYYDPKDPKTAIIKTGASIWTFIPLIAGLFFTAVFGLILRNKMK